MNNTINPKSKLVQYIPYPAAFQILHDRFEATPEEVGAWIYFGPGAELNGLRAYIGAKEWDVTPNRKHYSKRNAPSWFTYNRPFNNRVSSQYELNDYVAQLANCRFLKKNIDRFQPKDRWITGKVLVERWTGNSGITPRALVKSCISSDEYPKFLDHHPISGSTLASESDDEVWPPLEDGLYLVSAVEEVERVHGITPRKLNQIVDLQNKNTTPIKNDIHHENGINATSEESHQAMRQWHTENARNAANAKHDKPGGSREKQKKMRDIWATGKYSSRDTCAEQEFAGLNMSFSAARKALRNIPIDRDSGVPRDATRLTGPYHDG